MSSTSTTGTTPGDVPAAGRAPARRRPSTARLALARVRLELLTSSRERDAVVFVFAYPVLMMVIFGAVFGDQELPDGTPFARYFLAGIAATAIVLTSFQNLAVTIAREREDGTLKRLRGMPVPVSAYVLGKVGAVLVSSLAQTVLLLAVARLAYDVPLPADAEHWLRFAWVFALGTVAGCVLGIAASALPRSGASANAVITPLVLVLQFVSGVFFVYGSLPEWMRSVAELFPLKWMAQGMRAAFLPESAVAAEPGGSWELGTGALVLAAWALVGLVVCLRTFRWSRRDA
ncbi:ABC transporter permease [Kineococcus sp. SYSU DK004]|uniref:ABC transporter permease n=1 Tax=Kineococcus sp. SYSU DK004 TaxID=3383125 RepID=UPI003D7EF37D